MVNYRTVNLASSIDEHPDDAVALISRRSTTTYGELREQVARLRGGLVGLGLEPGDRLAIACGNNWYFASAYLAALGAGLIVVPLNPLSPARALQSQLSQMESDEPGATLSQRGQRLLVLRSELEEARAPEEEEEEGEADDQDHETGAGRQTRHHDGEEGYSRTEGHDHVEQGLIDSRICDDAEEAQPCAGF